MSSWSYQVLCDDDAMETFYELSVSNDLIGDIEKKLDNMKPYADYRTSVEGLVAAALVSYSLTKINAYNLLDLDLDDPKDNEKFEKDYKPFLNVVYHTDLSPLVKKAIRALKMMPNTGLGGWWYEEEQSLEWLENISGMERALKIYEASQKCEKKRKAAGIYSYEVLCSKDAVKTFKKLEKSTDLVNDIESILNSVTKTSDYHVFTAGLVAAALVAFSETENISYNNMLDLDLDDPDDRTKFDKEYDVFLDRVYDTDLSKLMKKASKVLQMMFDSKLGELWKAYDDNYHKWVRNIDEMIEELEKPFEKKQ